MQCLWAVLRGLDVKLGELIDLIAEANEASDDVIAAEESLNNGGCDDTIFRKQSRLASAKARLKMLRDKDIL